MFWGVDENLYNAMEMSKAEVVELRIQTAIQRRMSDADVALLREACEHM